MAAVFRFFNQRPYKGGVVVDGPERPLSEPITRLATPQTVLIPLAQHIGAPAKPVVQPGDPVELGTVIGEPQGFISTYIHSSVTGVVKDLVTLGRPGGRDIPAVLIEATEQAEIVREQPLVKYSPQITASEIRTKVLHAGIVGMGGAGFPTHVKLTPPDDQPIDSVLVNACECEPYLSADSRLLLEQAPELLAGLRLAMQAVGASQGYIGLEADRVETIQVLQELLGDDATIGVVVLPSKYPQGSEKHLIKSILNRTVPLGALPSSVGALVQNVATLIAVYYGVIYDQPLTHRVVTVNGGAVRKPGNFLVPVGTAIAEVLAAAEWEPDAAARVILGGPMMGKTAPSLAEPVTKTTSGILALTPDELARGERSVCIRCGRCLQSCPMGLYPGYIAEASLNEDLAAAEKAGALACLECGCCAFSCPGRRPLVQEIREAKLKIQQNQRERKGN